MNQVNHMRQGFSLLELIIAVAIVGVLLSVGLTLLNFGGVATRQGSQAIISAANAARLTAVRRNETVGLTVVPSSTGSTAALRVCRSVDPSAAPLACPADLALTETVLDFSAGELRRVRVLVNDGTAPVTVFFDRRGVLRNPMQVVVQVVDASGGNTRTLDLLATGRFDLR